MSEPFATLVPETFTSRHAAPLFCLGVTAYKALNASETKKGRWVGIFGVGGVGYLGIQLVKMKGFRVVAISRNKGRLNLGKRLGADSTILLIDDQKAFKENLRKKRDCWTTQ